MSAKNVLPTFLFGESRDKLRDWSVKTRDQLREDTRLADWVWRQRSRSFSWPVGWCFKSREAWTSALCRWNSWPVWSRSSQPAVHSNQFLAIHCPYYRHKCRVHKGGTESDKSSFYVVNTWEVGWRDLKNSPLASDEKILELGWCDWCFTAEKSVPVCSDEECTFHKGIPCRVQNYVDWSFPWFPF